MKLLFTRFFFKICVITLCLFAGNLSSGCQERSHTVRTVQPITRKRPYNPKKDKYRKRVKTVKKRYN